MNSHIAQNHKYINTKASVIANIFVSLQDVQAHGQHVVSEFSNLWFALFADDHLEVQLQMCSSSGLSSCSNNETTNN